MDKVRTMISKYIFFSKNSILVDLLAKHHKTNTLYITQLNIFSSITIVDEQKSTSTWFGCAKCFHKQISIELRVPEILERHTRCFYQTKCDHFSPTNHQLKPHYSLSIRVCIELSSHLVWVNTTLTDQKGCLRVTDK